MVSNRSSVVAILLIVACGALAAGCADRSGKPPKIRKVRGVATKIDLKNGVVAMSIEDEKGVPRTLSGAVRDDTEVLINGRIHRLDDVREGDKVTVFGYRERSGDGEKLVATRVEVDRPAEKDWKSTQQPPTSAPTSPSAAVSGTPGATRTE